MGGHAEVVQHRPVVARLDVPRVDERDRLVVLGRDPELAQLDIQLSRLKRKTPSLHTKPNKLYQNKQAKSNQVYLNQTNIIIKATKEIF